MASVHGAGAARRPQEFAGAEIYAWPTGDFRVSWSAIFAGVVVALVMQLSLSLLGLSIGFGVLNTAEAGAELSTIGIGAGIWMAVSSLISLFVGGWIAARLAGVTRPIRGLLHGIVMWSLVTLLTFYLMTTAVGGLISGAAGVIGRGVSAIGPVAAQQLTQGGGGGVAGALEEARRTGAGQDVIQGISSLFSTGTLSADGRTAMVNSLVNTGMTGDEANRTVDRWVTQAQEMRAVGAVGVRQTAQGVTEAISGAALWAFIALVLGAAAAAGGGWLGTMKPGRPTTT